MKSFLLLLALCAYASASEFNANSAPDTSDREIDSGKKINRILKDAATGAHPLVVSGGGGAVLYTASTPAQATVGTTAAQLVATSSKPQKVAVYNNSANYVTIVVGSGTPVNDSTPATPTGNGYGIVLVPRGYFETPADITQPIQAIASSAGSKVTITLYTQQ